MKLLIIRVLQRRKGSHDGRELRSREVSSCPSSGWKPTATARGNVIGRVLAASGSSRASAIGMGEHPPQHDQERQREGQGTAHGIAPRYPGCREDEALERFVEDYVSGVVDGAKAHSLNESWRYR